MKNFKEYRKETVLLMIKKIRKIIHFLIFNEDRKGKLEKKKTII
jgi:hypothetical protein